MSPDELRTAQARVGHWLEVDARFRPDGETRKLLLGYTQAPMWRQDIAALHAASLQASCVPQAAPEPVDQETMSDTNDNPLINNGENIIPPRLNVDAGAAYAEVYEAQRRYRQEYARTLIDPETAPRYLTDLGFRFEIDIYRQALHTADEAMAEEGVDLELRDRILHRMVAGREPYRGVSIRLHTDAQPITLPHGPFTIRATPYQSRYPRCDVTVYCACEQSYTWAADVSGGQLLAWLRGHRPPPDPEEKLPKKITAQLTQQVAQPLTPPPAEGTQP